MSEATNSATLNQFALANHRIPVDKSQSPSELIQDTQSAINYTMNSFSQDAGMMADRSMMSDDPELNRAPVGRPVKEMATKTHADVLNSSADNTEQSEPSAFVEAMTEAMQEPQAQQEVQPTPKKESQKEFNLRSMREQKEAAERKVKELENAYNQRHQWEMQQQYKQPQYNQPQNPVQDEINIADEELIDGRQLKKILAQAEQRNNERIQRLAQEAAANADATRLKSQFSDFDRVVTDEAIKDLAAIYPEEYQSALSSKSVYAAGKTMYNMIKNFGIQDMYESAKPQQQKQIAYQDQDRRIQNNLARPRTAAKVGMQADGSTLGQLGDYSRRVLTEADKQRVRDRLNNSRMYSN